MEPNNLFVNRKDELEYLEHNYKKSGKQLIILYGRRRVGKTELITHFCDKKNAIYFLADKRGTEINAERFAALCSKHFNDTTPVVKHFDDVFRYIKTRILKEKLVIVIDEFSYLVEKDDSVPSVFQLIIDEVLNETNVFLILCGSSISMMYKGTLSYESPLYGRRSGEWRVKSMLLKDIKKFYPNKKFEELVRIYSVIGGVPAYATHFNGTDIFDCIKNNILKKGEFLYNEPEVLLKEELRDPSSYFSILEAMASSTKLTDIANKSRIPAKDMPKYLKTLEELELIHKINPITEKKSKKSLYFIKDNFFRFWFKFVYPRKSELEAGHIDEVLSLIKKDFNSYVGRSFETVCKEYLEEKNPIPFSRIGKWWGYIREEKAKERKIEEIDIVMIDEINKAILFAECKWQDNVDASAILNSLKQKAKKVEWQNDKRKEYFAVFAKGFEEKLKEDNAFLFDSSDLNI